MSTNRPMKLNGYMRISSPEGIEIGDTPIGNSELADGSYGLIEHVMPECCNPDSKDGLSAQSFADRVEARLFAGLIARPRAKATAFGFSAKFIAD